VAERFVARNAFAANTGAVRQLIEDGQLTPIVDRVFPLVEVPEALRRLEAGKARGKIAITI
jgi:NADPH:quinone reductase-like Zn-dependent oxidoreductase